MSGLNISGFIKHGGDGGGGGRGQWLREWKKNGVGEITVWFNVRAPIVPSFSHQFMLEDTYDDKETKKKIPVLRYPRFVTPDPEIVARHQYFRHPNGMLKTPPDRDPFLLLREWLRHADHLPLEEPIFKWQDFKNHKLIVWERGVISGLVKSGNHNWNHSLDTKLEYIYVVVDNDNIDDGPVLAREGKLLAQRIVEVITQQQSMFGEDEGDPAQFPYAFRWVAVDAPSPMNRYKAFKAEDAEHTDEVWAQLCREDFPDPTPYGVPGDGDMVKIRDAFAAAAQVELPLDEIFSEDSAVRQALIRGDLNRAPARASKAAQARGTAPETTKPPVPKPGAKPGTKPAAAPAGQQTKGPQPRRKKVEAPAEPEPAPEEPEEPETIPCDDCQHPMLATDSKCPNCGTEYEVDEPDEPKPKAAPKPVPGKPAAQAKPAPGKPTAGKPAQAKPKAGAAAPKAAPKTAPKQEEPAGGGQQTNCWSCQAELNGSIMCPECGLEQGDDIPF